MLNNPLFMMYAMECEGDLPTHHGMMEQAIRKIVELEDPDDWDAVQDCLYSCNIPPSMLTPAELRYIETEVDRRRSLYY